jgi:molybdate transport system substrate-binding protein
MVVDGDLIMRKHVVSVLSSVGKGIIASIVLTMALSPIAAAAEIKVLCTQALKGTMAKLGPQYESKTGDKLLVTYGATDQLLTRVNQGDPVDVIIVTGPALAGLAKSEKVVDSSRTDIARSGIGVAVRHGATPPDISTVEAFKKSLLAAKSITYTNPADGGASAVYFVELIKKLGIAEQLQPKTKFAPGGTSSGALVARGEAELAVQMISELVPVPGVDIVGPLPADVQSFTVLSAGISKGAANPAAAGKLIQFLSSPATAPVLREAGLEPPK